MGMNYIEQKSISAEDTFTDWVLFTSGTYVDLSISGTFSATVTLQRKFEKYGSPLDVDTFTSSAEKDFYVAATAYYRVGIKTGDYTSGTANVKMVT